MRHHHRGRTFGRKRDQRAAFVRSLAEALIVRERIVTTEARAKEVRPFVEGLVTRAKKGGASSRRTLIAALGGRARAAKKLAEVIAPRFKERSGGYTRVVKVAKRSADGRRSAVIEFVS